LGFYEHVDAVPVLSGGLMGGFRFPLGKGTGSRIWYAETYIRSGYPHIFGIGISFIPPLKEIRR
jgi:hypothetical protein